MFDSVGKTLDPEAGKRRAFSAILTVVLLGSLVGGIFAYLAWQAAKAVLPEVFDNETFMVAIDEVMEEEQPELSLPAPPKQAAGGIADEKEPEEPEDEPEPEVPEEMVEDIESLEEEVSKEVTSVEGNPDAEGNSEGDPDGDPNGSEYGVAGGTGTGVGGGPRVFHHSELRIKGRFISPTYPEFAKAMNLGETVACRVRIFISEQGVPYDFKFEACPKVFHESAREALAKNRWVPAKMDGQKVPAQFVIQFNYTLK